MSVHGQAALGASLCFSIAVKPFRALGAIRFKRIRMLIMAVGLFFAAFASGGLPMLIAESLAILLISGLVGIVLDDTFYLLDSVELDCG